MPLELPCLGPSETLATRDALGQTPIPLEGPALEFPIEQWQYQMLRIPSQVACQESSPR